MIITQTKFNSLPEQVEENKKNIKLLDDALEGISSGKMIGKNIWTNPDATKAFENQVVTSEEYLKPYNVMKIYIINYVSASELTVQTVMLDLDVVYPVEFSYIIGTQKHYRTVKYNTVNNEIEFSAESVIDLLTGEVEEGTNTYLVPLAMIGFIEEVTV